MSSSGKLRTGCLELTALDSAVRCWYSCSKSASLIAVAIPVDVPSWLVPEVVIGRVLEVCYNVFIENFDLTILQLCFPT